jgi:hypothetical protein
MIYRSPGKHRREGLCDRKLVARLATNPLDGMTFANGRVSVSDREVAGSSPSLAKCEFSKNQIAWDKVRRILRPGAAALKSARRMLRRIWEAHDYFNRVPC